MGDQLAKENRGEGEDGQQEKEKHDHDVNRNHAGETHYGVENHHPIEHCKNHADYSDTNHHNPNNHHANIKHTNHNQADINHKHNHTAEYHHPSDHNRTQLTVTPLSMASIAFGGSTSCMLYKKAGCHIADEYFRVGVSVEDLGFWGWGGNVVRSFTCVRPN